MPRKLGGLGMVNINNFWKALRLSWFRRFIDSKSTWAKLHKLETSPYTFNPITSNFDDLNKARMQCKNGFWKELYSSLISCRLNVLKKYPGEFITIPIIREPMVTKNLKAIQQDWSKIEMLNTILDANGKITEWEHLTRNKRPLG